MGLIILLGVAVIIAAQFSNPVLFGADGYLHIRMSEFIRQYGLNYDFHWARYSTFANNFSDKDLFYHILIVPLTFMPDIFQGAKFAACIFAIFLYLVFFLLLRRYCQRPLIPIFLITLFLSVPFLEAISRLRPMIFIIALTLIFIHFLIQKNQGALFLITLLYALSHVSSPLLLVFVLLGESIRFINEREFIWKSVRTVALALIIGFLIHPNFPDNFLVFYLNGILVPFYALKWGLELGAEFFPISTREYILGYPFILIGLILLLAASLSEANKFRFSTKIWMAITGFFFVISFFSRRYIIHSYPFILISLSCYFSDWWQAQAGREKFFQQRTVRLWTLVACIFVFIFLGVRTLNGFHNNTLAKGEFNRHYENVAQWLKKYVPSGEIIFHTNWSDSQYFIGLAPEYDYFVTFDPIYMYYWNPDKYRLYRNISFGQTRDPYVLLKKEFGVRFGYAGKNYFSGLIAQIRGDRRFEVLAEDNFGLLFKLR